MKYWEIIADNLSKAGEKQIVPQTPPERPGPQASGEADYVIVVSNTGSKVGRIRIVNRNHSIT
jgi:hypothetical protein